MLSRSHEGDGFPQCLSALNRFPPKDQVAPWGAPAALQVREWRDQATLGPSDSSERRLLF
jgi:hypothetical protein